MASVRKVRTKLGVAYQARWRERGPDGRDLFRAKNFATARAAKEHAATVALVVERRNVGDPERLTVASFADRYVTALAEAGERSPATITSYRKCLRLACRELGQIPLARLTTAHVDDAYAAMLRRPLTKATVRYVHVILAIALKRAVKRGLIASNPADNATPPAMKVSKVKAFTAAQVRALLTVAERDPETHAIVAILLAAGLRRSELIGLAFDCVDIEGGTITIRRIVIEVGGRPVERDRGKSAAALRTIAIPPVVVELLRAQRTRVQEAMLSWGPGYRREPLYVFPGPGGAPMPPPLLTKRLRRLMRAAGITGPSPCHAWRHTSGSSLFDATGNVKTVQRRLGHSSAATTMRIYVHAVEERDREASEHFERLLSKP